MPAPPSPSPGSGVKPSWGDAVAVVGGVLLGMLSVQVLKAPELPLLHPLPAGLVVFLPLGMALLMGSLRPEATATRFFSGLPFAMTSLAGASAAALAGSLILQNPGPAEAVRLGKALPFLQRLGLTDVFHMPWFGALVACMALSLAVASGRRLRKLNLRNLVFLATHLGTLLVLGGGALSSLATRTGHLRLLEGEPARVLNLQRGGRAELPQEIRLVSFHVEPFELEAVPVDPQNERLRPGRRPLPRMTPGARFRLGDWELECLEAIPSARPEIRPVPDPAGEWTMELGLEAHGERATLTLAPSMGLRRLGGAIVATLVEAPPGRLEELTEATRRAMEQDGAPGVAFLGSEGSVQTLVRPPGGQTSLRTGSQALDPITFGPVRLIPSTPVQAHLELRWIAATGLQPQPTGAARIRAVRGAQSREAWIAAGPSGADPFHLDDTLALRLLEPQPKRFRSRIQTGGREFEIQVNTPQRVGSWDLVQVGYEAGPGGRAVSVLKATADPSIPPVFLGLALVLLGVAGALWVLPRTLEAP